MLAAMLVSILLGITDVERQQKAQGLLNLGAFRP
jgi:hypothetical protein